MKRIHVNINTIRSNAKHGKNEPVVRIQEGKTVTYCHEIEILGPSKMVYRPGKPLSCGAKVWIETKAEVKVKR